MSSKVPFRILIVDDDIYNQVKESEKWISGAGSLAAQHCQFVDELLPVEGVEIMLAHDAALRKLFLLTPAGRRVVGRCCKQCPIEEKANEDKPGKNKRCAKPECLAHRACEYPEQWLGQFHVIVLDMKGIGSLRSEKENQLHSAITSHLGWIRETPEKVDIKSLLADKKIQGVMFYHRYLEHLTSARAVIVLTQQDYTNVGKKGTPAPIRELLEPFCQDENHLFKEVNLLPAHIPWTVKHGKTGGAGIRIARLIHSLHEDFASGYEMLTNRGQIEFAAVTDHPVLILGESGTGKEYVARAIRRAWEREKHAMSSSRRGYAGLEQEAEAAVESVVDGKYDANDGDAEVDGDGADEHQLGHAVLNCGCITEADARAYLYGAVRGSSAGALSHLPGIILQACGCKVLGYDKPDKRRKLSLEKALLNARDAAREISDFTAKMDPAMASVKVKRVMETIQDLLHPKQVYGMLSDPQSYHSLPQLLVDVETHLQNLMDGTDVAEQFKQKLLMHFTGRLIENPKSSNRFDLCFTKEAGVLGTLFLDELADLPPLAQSLLLRFLESGTQEIEPLGYPGRITGVRVRVVAATSDKEVAKMAGVENLKERAGERPRPYSVRYDLLQRLRWHTIRVEPVNQHNVEATIHAMTYNADQEMREELSATSEVGGNGGNGLVWDEGAVAALKKRALERAESVYFNHRRELRRIITMTTHHVGKGRLRGLRGFEDGRVTEESVSRFLTAPSPMRPSPVEHQTFVQPHSQQPDKELRPEELQLRADIEAILPNLSKGWKHLDLRNAIKAVPGSALQIGALLQAAAGLGAAESGYCGRESPDRIDEAPRYGIAYAVSLGEASWGTLRTQLRKVGVRFDASGEKDSHTGVHIKQPRAKE
ncbi:sigma-54 interacting transcriptional regulator [Roseimicrobium gellanilyticum]|uniref:Sigma-54 interacting transcriptional regulator n=1 Tax=Roseimicrobium gellanilyticum TaxID=748857 RepID=A0A366H6J9_9BACT|nr:sigma 54-interacting transcriptional regulator [Roseimicrobium gellanilyticum]RBP36886.1 sigma-54 interacting transcriptional regulator [Roseimicrobium gellanilyticum]